MSLYDELRNKYNIQAPAKVSSKTYKTDGSIFDGLGTDYDWHTQGGKTLKSWESQLKEKSRALSKMDTSSTMYEYRRKILDYMQSDKRYGTDEAYTSTVDADIDKYNADLDAWNSERQGAYDRYQTMLDRYNAGVKTWNRYLDEQQKQYAATYGNADWLTSEAEKAAADVEKAQSEYAEAARGNNLWGRLGNIITASNEFKSGRFDEGNKAVSAYANSKENKQTAKAELERAREYQGKIAGYQSTLTTPQTAEEWEEYKGKTEEELNAQIAEAEKELNTLKGLNYNPNYTEEAALMGDATPTGYYDKRIAALQKQIDAAERAKERAKYNTELGTIEAQYASAKGIYDASVPDMDYHIVNHPENASGNTVIRQMNDDERRTYNAIYAAEGKEEADRYLDLIADRVGARRSAETTEKWQEFTYAAPVTANIASVGTNLVSGAGLADVALQNVINKVTGADRPVNYNTAAMQPYYAMQAVRGTTAQGLTDASGTIHIDDSHPLWKAMLDGKGMGDLYQLGMSMVDSMATAGIARALGGTKLANFMATSLLGGSAGTQGVISALEAGATDGQALAMGLANGIFEMLFEEVSIDKLINGSPRNLVLAMLQQGGVEAWEEANTTFANTIADALIMAENSDWQQNVQKYYAQYLDEHSEEADFSTHKAMEWAKKQAYKEAAGAILFDAIGGFISGGIMGGGATVLNDISARGLYSDAESQRALVDEALEINSGNQKAINAAKRLDAGKTLSGETLLELTDENERAIAADEKYQREVLGAAMLSEDRAANNTPVRAEETKPITLEGLSAKYGDQAEAFKRTFIPGQNMEAYDKAYQQAYEYGATWTSDETPSDILTNMKNLSPLTETQRELAFAAGKASVTFEAQKQEQANRALMNGNANRKIGTVRAIDGVNLAAMREKFNDTQRRAYKVLSRIAAATGINIVIYNSATNDAGDFTDAEGKFTWDEDTVYLDMNSGLANIRDMDSAGNYTVLRTFSHEFTHFIEKWNPTEYIKFREDVFAVMNEQLKAENSGSDNPVTVDDLIKAKQQSYRRIDSNFGYEKASREVMADAMTDIMPDSKLMEKLYNKDKNLVERLIGKLKEFIADIKAYFASIKGSAQKTEAALLKREVNGELHYLQSIVDAFDSIAEKAVENYQAAVSQGVTGKTANALRGAAGYQKVLIGGDAWTQYAENFPTKTFGKTQYELRGEYERKLFEAKTALADALDHGDAGDDNLIPVGKLPSFLKEILESDGDMYIYRNHAYENMVSKKQAIEDGRPTKRDGKDIHFHAIGEERMAEAIASTVSPIMTIAEKTVHGNPAVRMLLPVEGDNELPLYAYMSFYDVHPINGSMVKRPHLVLTISDGKLETEDGHSGYIDIINDAIDGNKIIQYDNEKRAYLTVTAQQTRLGSITVHTLEQSIAEYKKEVNAFKQKNKISYALRDTFNAEVTQLDANARKIVTAARQRASYSGSIATMTAERFDAASKELNYGAGKFSNYGKGYYAFIDPYDFIYLTTGGSVQQFLDNNPNGLNEGISADWGTPNNIQESGPLFLRVERGENGKWKVTGHEGRHRMAALYRAGIDNVAVMVRTAETANMQPINLAHLSPQFRTGGDVYLHNLIPGSADYNNIAKYIFTEAHGNVLPDDKSIQYQLRSPGISDREILKQAAIDAKEQNAGKFTEEQKASLFVFQARLHKLETSEARRQEFLTQKRELLKGREPKDVQGEEKVHLRKIQNNLDTINGQIRRYREDLLRVEQNGVLEKVLRQARSNIEKDVKQRGVEKLRDYKNRRNDTEEARKYRKRITDSAMQLSEWLQKNSDKEHVPEVLKAPLTELLTSIDLSSKRLLNGGEPTKADEKFAANLMRLKSLIDGQQGVIEGNDDALDEVGAYLDISTENRQFLNNLAEAIVNLSRGEVFTVNRMNTEQLKAFSKFLANLSKAIRQANKTLANARYKNIPEMAQNSMQHFDEMGKASDREGTGAAKFLQWTNATPYYAFKRFGDAGKALFDGFTRGWETLAMNAKEIIAFTNELYTSEEIRKWRSDIHDITLEDGSKIRMTSAQIMELSMLINREQAQKHIQAGGIRIGTIEQTVGNINDTEHYHFSLQDIAKVLTLLDERQRTVAKELQQYMAKRGSEWGNAISMARFGYEFYDEGEAYYPIRTDSNGRPMRDTDEQTNSMFRLLNLSASKSLNPKANNALIVGDIFDTFTDHMADMAKLNALGLPLLDAIKWFNYTERTNNADGTMDEEGVKKSMEQAFGPAAASYFRTLLKDINGVKEGGDRGLNVLGRITSRYKVAAVAANLRVAALQPTSYVRAMYVLDPKNMARALLFKRNRYKEALQYSGTAVWKSLGYYDTDISRSMRSQIEHDDTWLDKVKDKSMFLAELGDRRTWGRLWVACKLEAKQRNEALEGEELNKATADIFREVIYATQVMDSTLTRSEMMRGGTMRTKLASAFMAEPTLSANILMDAASEYAIESRKSGKEEAWKKTRGKIGLAFVTYVCSMSAAAFVESVLDAMRDDDDYETRLEKFNQAFFGEDGILSGNLAQDLTILGKIPVVKDIVDTVTGNKRSDMSVASVEALTTSIRIWSETIRLANGTLEAPTKVTYNGRMTQWGKIYKTLQALSQMSGLAVSNFMRDGIAIWNSTVAFNNPDYKLKTYDAGLKSNVKYAYQDGTLSEEDAIDKLIFGGIAKNEDEAYFMLQKGKYTDVKIALESEDLTAFGDAVKVLEEHGVNEKSVMAEVRSLIGEQYKNGDIDESKANGLLIGYAGLTWEQAERYVDDWTLQKNTGYSVSDISAALRNGEITQTEAEKMWRDYGGKTADEAHIKAQSIVLDMKYPGWSSVESALTKYQKYGADAGISESKYIDSLYHLDQFVGEDANGDGEIDSNSLRQQRWDYINGLDISTEAKDALHLAYYKESTLRKAPWHN